MLSSPTASHLNGNGHLAARLRAAGVLGPARTVYDACTQAHAHLYHADTGQMQDLPAGLLPWRKPPPLPAHGALAGMVLIVRVRQRARRTPCQPRNTLIS